MGRKIPGRKHRGVKDPEKQAAERLNSIKDKINAPPTNPDIQEVSKTLQKIIDLKNKTKSGAFKLFKKKKPKPAEVADNDEAKIITENPKEPAFKQLPNETDKQFLHRVNKICENVKKEAAFENKYGVEIKRDAGGEIKVVKRPKDELEQLLKKVRKEKAEKKVKKKKKKTLEGQPVRLTKSQKWEKKKKEKKLKKKLKTQEELIHPKDSVQFGETVHAPPTLTTPKKAVKTTAPRPGQKKLLLTNILQKPPWTKKKVAIVKGKDESVKVTKKVIDKTGKRKDLPNALRRQLDKQQKEVIGAYKQLKSKKHAGS